MSGGAKPPKSLQNMSGIKFGDVAVNVQVSMLDCPCHAGLLKGIKCFNNVWLHWLSVNYIPLIRGFSTFLLFSFLVIIPQVATLHIKSFVPLTFSSSGSCRLLSHEWFYGLMHYGIDPIGQ